MVDMGTFNRLSSSEQDEFRSLTSRFIKAVFKSSANDGFHFSQIYKVFECEGKYFMAKSQSDKPLGNIYSSSKAILDALVTDAVQNYGR
jgi:hypothetical protein